MVIATIISKIDIQSLAVMFYFLLKYQFSVISFLSVSISL